MKRHLATICGIVISLEVTSVVLATPISGTISMGGEANLDSSDLSTATTVESWPLVYVVADSGSFSTIADFALVNMSSPWVFAPAPGQPLTDLWSIGNFQFNFQSDTVSQDQDSLTIFGYGTIVDTASGSGYDPTEFEWELAAESPPTGGPVQFTFSATAEPNPNITTVPDGGLTVAFLGLAVAGMEGLRRKWSKA